MPTPLTIHQGRVMPLRRSDVDTDQITPAEYCKRITRSGFSDALFARWRQEAGFVLNEPARAEASILVAGPKFGTGSSREHAVWALRDWGFAVVIAPSFGDIFRRNALRNGLLACVLGDEAVTELMSAAEVDPSLQVTVDLERCRIEFGDRGWSFEVDERARWLLLNGLDDIELTLAEVAAISAFEGGRPSWLPVIHQRAEARDQTSGGAA